MIFPARTRRIRGSIGKYLLLTLLLSLVGCHDSPQSYNLGGQISGLSAAGLVLVNDGATPLTVPAGSSSFEFSYRIRQGSEYNVTVAAQPEAQVCTVTNGTGTVRRTITDIQVACAAETHVVAGSIAGLNADGLVLQLNGADDLELAVNAAAFEFATPVTVGSDYHVTVLAQPQWQVCTVMNGTGTVHHTITDIQVACSAETHSVAGSIAGLATAGLVLQLNGADDLALPANADSFEFETPVAAGSSYHVTVLAQPAGLSCSVNNGDASNINADIDNVQVVCSVTTHAIRGTVTGLTDAGLILQNNGADDLAVGAGSSSFQFAAPIADGGTYNVTVFSQPSGQTCSIGSGSGTAQSSITNIAVTCADIPVYTVTASAGANGSISPSGAVTANQGEGVAFLATSDAGYTVSQWLLDGMVVQTGGSTYELDNIQANATLEVNFGMVALTASVSTLALSVNDMATNAALTGSARSITITNTGSLVATNVSVSAPMFPVGTIMSGNTCGSTLAPFSSCLITVVPGANATSSCTSGIAATPDVVIVSADNAADVSIDVLVLGYGCIYQGGHLFSVDDTTPSTTSIGGKAAATDDQAPAHPNGIMWSSDYQNVGVANGSLTPCVSDDDGACNTTRILAQYPAISYPRASFAAGLCELENGGGYSDWYLPAYCEANDCGVGRQTMQDNLAHNNLASLSGFYWTSTEYAANPTTTVRVARFTTNVPVEATGTKDELVGVRCVRELSH